MQLALLSLALCLGSVVALVPDQCRKVAGDVTFDFDKISTNVYKFEYGNQLSDVKLWDSAYSAGIKVDDNVYLTLTFNQKDGNQLINTYTIVEQNQQYFTTQLLDSTGNPTEIVTIITVYAYKTDAYIAYTICDGKNTKDETRFVLSLGAYKLTPADLRRIQALDKQNNFSTPLVKIATGTKLV